MERVFNFSAGPSMLPLPVLEKAQAELCSYEHSGMSVMEMSHRSRIYMDIYHHAESALRDVLEIPDSYAVLFLQGGATLQFSMISMNLAPRGATALYAVTGVFAKKAAAEGARWVNAVKVTDCGSEGFIPDLPADLPEDAVYLHITGNNTAYGTMYTSTPEHGKVPLVADWSSGILGSRIPVQDYDLIYAGAQKNMGIAGVTVVILKKELLERETDPLLPDLMNYRSLAKAESMINTPSTYGIYLLGLVCDWLKDLGGVDAMEAINRKKAGMLYDILDHSSLYQGFARRDSRSLTNVTFTLRQSELTESFLKGTESLGLIGLKGYRSIGGIRASIYNGMPVEGVETLADYMRRFEQNA